jgi:endonuclease YncB( thermonuclease family)
MTRRLFLLFAITTALLAEDFSGQVVGISDGDTIRVLHEGREERVRLWGIDAPESKQPWGTRAKQSTGDLAFSKVVTVHVRDIDRYKRTVAEIILPDGRNLNQGLVRAGLAWRYRQFAKDDALLPALEQEARAAKRGLWADPSPVHPGSGGRRRGCVERGRARNLRDPLSEHRPERTQIGYPLATVRTGPRCDRTRVPQHEEPDPKQDQRNRDEEI